MKGVLKDNSGKPLVDAMVMIADGPVPFPDIASVTNEKGEFFLSGITVPGEYIIQIQHEDSVVKRPVSISATDSIITVQL